MYYSLFDIDLCELVVHCPTSRKKGGSRRIPRVIYDLPYMVPYNK